MDEIQKIYHDMSTVDDINKYLSDTDDGESGIIEFKSVTKTLNSKNAIANNKALMAKEMCAFANSEGGILVVGVEVKDGKVVPACEEPNLENFLEKQKISRYLEPSLKGLNFKSLSVADGGNKPVIIMIPKSDFLPHRVISNYSNIDQNEAKGIAGEYFVREGSDSHKIPEQLVRAMYLSAGRLPRFEIKPDVELFYGKDKYEHSRIEIKSVVNPDPTKFIKDYYYDMKATLFDDKFEEIPIKNSNKVYSNSSSPIYPSNEEYVIDSGYRIETGIPSRFENDTIYNSTKGNISYEEFLGIRLVVINVRYACEGMSLVDRDFYFIVKNTTHEDYLKFPLTTSFRPSKLYEYLFIDKRIPSMEDEEMINSGYGNEVTNVANTLNLNKLK